VQLTPEINSLTWRLNLRGKAGSRLNTNNCFPYIECKHERISVSRSSCLPWSALSNGGPIMATGNRRLDRSASDLAIPADDIVPKKRSISRVDWPTPEQLRTARRERGLVLRAIVACLARKVSLAFGRRSRPGGLAAKSPIEQ
jgi:hypothetical protein